MPDSFESTTSTFFSTTTQTTNPKRNQNFQPLTTEPLTTNDPTTTTTGSSTVISTTTKTSGFDSTLLVDERGVLITDFLTTEISSTTELQKSTTDNFVKTATTTEFSALPTDFTISETNKNFDENLNFGIPPILIEEIEEIEEEGSEDYNERQGMFKKQLYSISDFKLYHFLSFFILAPKNRLWDTPNFGDFGTCIYFWGRHLSITS